METTNKLKERSHSLKEKALEIFSKYSMIIILAVLLVAFQLMTDGIFWRPLNITNLVLQNSHILVLAAGMLLVVLLGHVDLSVGSVMAFVGAIAGVLMVNNGISPWLAVPLCLLMGAVIGAWQGFWVAYVGIPAFIVTLSGLLMFRGLTQVVLGVNHWRRFPRHSNKFLLGICQILQAVRSIYFP